MALGGCCYAVITVLSQCFEIRLDPRGVESFGRPCRVRLKSEGTRWRTGGELKGKLANGVGSQYSHTTSERGVPSITKADAHTSAASSRLNWLPRRFKWTRPFRRKKKSGFCACAITFLTHYTLFMDGFGGLVISMLASGTQVCGFKPGRSRWIFRT